MDPFSCYSVSPKDPWIFRSITIHQIKGIKVCFEGRGRSMDPFFVTVGVKRIHGSFTPLRVHLIKSISKGGRSMDSFLFQDVI